MPDSQIVDEIIDSLKFNADSWTMSTFHCTLKHDINRDQTRKLPCGCQWMKCTPDEAEPHDFLYANGVRNCFRVARPSFLKLIHTSGVVLVDLKPRTCLFGWHVVAPAHVTVRWWDAWRLGSAIKQWRVVSLKDQLNHFPPGAGPCYMRTGSPPNDSPTKLHTEGAVWWFAAVAFAPITI